MTLSRRDLLRSSALTGATIAVGGVFSGLPSGLAHAGRKLRQPSLGYGPLFPDPAGILDLPEGFKYQIIAKGGSQYATGFSTYDDGQKVAGDADGAASYAIGGNRTVLVTNHELSTSEFGEGVPLTFAGNPVPTYDPGAPGGTSNIVMAARRSSSASRTRRRPSRSPARGAPPGPPERGLAAATTGSYVLALEACRAVPGGDP
jgi:secreted PhoX family phosphatase